MPIAILLDLHGNLYACQSNIPNKEVRAKVYVNEVELDSTDPT